MPFVPSSVIAKLTSCCIPNFMKSSEKLLTTPSFKPPFIGSIDNGTSSTRFIIFDKNGKIVTTTQKEYPQYYPQQGWAEQNLDELYSYTNDCIESCIEKFRDLKLDLMDLKAIGITNQRETTCVWSRRTGKPLYNAVVWLDTRTQELVKELITKTPTKSKDSFQKICGLPLSTYFSAVKLHWLLRNVEQVKQAAKEDDLMFGTVDSWLLYKFSNGIHYTDVTNASRTMLMNIKTREWDTEMLEFFDIPKSCLPEIKSSSEVYGHIDHGSLKGVPISGILGDQQAALVGQKCFKSGMLKNTYGTGCFMLCNMGTEPIFSTHGLLTTVGYQLGPNAPCYYALEGSIAIAGASVKWLRDNLKIITKANQVGEYAFNVKDNGGCYFVPAFSGHQVNRIICTSLER